MESTLNQIRRGPTWKARDGKLFPDGLSEGVGEEGHDLEVGGVVEEAYLDKGYQGRLHKLWKSRT